MSDLSVEMLALRAIRNSRAKFRNAVLAAARSHRQANPLDGLTTLTGEEVQSLQSAGMESIAELLFVQSDLELNKDAERIEQFLTKHNQDMQALVSELTEQRRHKVEGGASLTALRKSFFTEARIQELVVATQFGGAYFSQSDIGRILICLMSPETCRKYLETLGDCGFLVRQGSSAIPIRSRNIIENLYREHMRRIVEGAAAMVQTGVKVREPAL